MKKASLIVSIILFASTSGVFGQKPDTLIKKLDSLSHKTDSANGQHNNTSPGAYNEATSITFPSYFILLGSDLKQAFTKPFHMGRKDWGKFGRFALVAGVMALADEPVQRFALDLREGSPPLQKISRQVTNFGGMYEAYTLGALGAYGFIFKNKKMQTTTLLASQAYITGAAVESVLKTLSGRSRPYFTDSTKVQAEPTFYGPFYKTPRDQNGRRTNSSFPSGHTTVAFAAATVYAMEYKDRPIVPILAYSAATLIGLSRITENRHWATDVLAGAALGYLSGRLVVNNYHRYAKLKSPKQSKNTVSFNLQYNFGHISPGLVYTFH
ncbi:MAG: phosphatase PAP2 family protein [Sphingobacteriales bacterium]